ncbi:MAG TPA: MFS transporter [Candidatus Corynebacterium gallistercoris]|uniref:MFS transporter n=1 Tax=Candidatus Corynebacterium gallistercoris TaxID=2838530 RepID=A0A9D1RYB1_9CORY|nr:MFS transporter [Candidatus Corynebacterium gallistercoris]
MDQAKEPAQQQPRPYTPKDRGYTMALIASLCSGLASYNALYATQAILPTLTEDFGVTPSTAALTVSAATGGLALMVIPTGIISERFGRRIILQVSVLVSTFLSLLLVVLPSIQSIIAIRLVQGFAIAGVPAVMMAFLAEEVDKKYLPRIMGFYIAGNSLGGLIGRLIPGIALDFFPWRTAIALSAVFAIAMAILTVFTLPHQRFFQPKKITLAHELHAFATHLTNPTLVKLFALPFLTMGAFVSLYNYLGFRLIDRFGLPEALAALIFITYLSGTWTSTRAGNLVERFGSRKVVVGCTATALLALLALLIPSLPVTVIAVFLFTGAFFAGHSVASSWVGEVATHDRAEASSCYILCYYVGSSIIGWCSGYVFHLGWAPLVGWLVLLFGAALVTAFFISSSRATPP